VKDPALFADWILDYGGERFFLGADVKEEKIAVGGWLETTELSVFDFVEDYIRKGISQVFCTDISKDGKLEGPSLDLYRELIGRFPDLHFVASGGVSNMDDVLSLKAIGCKGVIIGKAIYEGRITIEELSKLNQAL